MCNRQTVCSTKGVSMSDQIRSIEDERPQQSRDDEVRAVVSQSVPEHLKGGDSCAACACSTPEYPTGRVADTPGMP